jgi:signal transduction histidine kinase
MPQLISRKLIAGYITIIVFLIIVAFCGIAGMKKIGNLSLTNQSLSVQQENFEKVQSEADKQYKKYILILYILVLLTIVTSILFFIPILKRIDSGLKTTISSARRLSESLPNCLPPERGKQDELEYLELLLNSFNNNFQRTIEELKQSHEASERQEKFALLSKIAGKVGHELRNPLGAIKNSVYYLNITLNQEQHDIKEILEIINLEIGRADKIIGDLLDYSRTRQPSRKTIVIADLLGNIIKSLNIPASIKVIENHGKDPVTFEADPDQIHSAFRNIISNAVEAMPGGGTLEITSKAYDCGVMVSVRDSGEGIPDENKAKIFEPLFTSRQGGIGLGLAIAKKHINAHNGVIELKSKEGEGSQFDIYFPEA